jgi:hypothetical protein
MEDYDVTTFQAACTRRLSQCPAGSVGTRLRLARLMNVVAVVCIGCLDFYVIADFEHPRFHVAQTSDLP